MNRELARQLLAETAPGTDWSALTDEESLADAGFDSLDKATYFMKIEEHCGRPIPDEAYEAIDSIKSLLEYLAE